MRQIGRAVRIIPIKLNGSKAMPAASRSLKDLFLAALDVAAEQRAVWLDRECAGDMALRKQVELLLAAHDTPPLRAPPMGPRARSSPRNASAKRS